MDSLSDLGFIISSLEKSLEKNGEQPLTNRWLLNICKVAQKKKESEEVDMWEWTVYDAGGIR